MSEYLYAVQDANGREICFVTSEDDNLKSIKTGDVVTIEDGNGTQLATGTSTSGNPTPFQLHRWPVEDKYSEPDSFPVIEAAESDTPPIEAAPTSEPTK